MKDDGKKMKEGSQVFGSEARDALRSPRSHMLHEHQVLLQAGEEETECVKKPDAV